MFLDHYDYDGFVSNLHLITLFWSELLWPVLVPVIVIIITGMMLCNLGPFVCVCIAMIM